MNQTDAAVDSLPWTDDELDVLSAEAKRKSERLGDRVAARYSLPEENAYRFLARHFHIPFIGRLDGVVSEELIRDISSDLFKEGKCFPLNADDDLLHIVVTDPTDMTIELEIGLAAALPVAISLTTPSEMYRMHKQLFGGESAFRHSIEKISREYEYQLKDHEEDLSLEEIRKRTEAEPVVRMVRMIFEEAIKLKASDIHVEPTESNAVIRFRVDGMLRQFMDLNKWMYIPFTSRVKILADLDIAEKRLPQDGRIRYVIGDSQFDFRVSTLPTIYGEKSVIRILKHDQSLLDLGNVGMEGSMLEDLSELIEKPQGMIFVTGPTGSGKSTTLFACLNRIRSKAINITTIENPIEYKLEGINQVQINEKAGVTFAGTLRSILRQDPDVILIGETRDTETAEIAMQASQTGHLVFSTLHTNDSVSAITRLKDLGIPGFLISSSLLAILSQRLVRMLCPHCKKKAPVSEGTARRWRSILGSIPIPESYAAVGCQKCNGVGYAGRGGIFELVKVNETIRDLISEDITETRLRQRIREMGMHSIIQNGIIKIADGITTPEELLRVVLVDDVAKENESGTQEGGEK
jgi:type IV pilus assembly protein PilB